MEYFQKYFSESESLTSDEKCLCDALEICNKMILENYNDNPEFLKQSIASSFCGKCWYDKKLIVSCDDCENDKTSCICLKCYQNGNHKGHNVTIRYGQNASCDCGNTALWKRTGFCKDHPGPSDDPDITDIPKDLSEKFILCFSSLLSKLTFSLSVSLKSTKAIIDWIKEKLDYGDAVKRCFAKAFEKSDIKSFIRQFSLTDSEIGDKLGSMIIGLCSEAYFSQHVIPKMVKCLFEIIPEYYSIAMKAYTSSNTEEVDDCMKKLHALKGFGHCYSHLFYNTTIKYIMPAIDWKKDFISIIHIINQIILNAPRKSVQTKTRIDGFFCSIPDFIKQSTDDDVKAFIIDYARELAVVAGKKPLKRVFGDKSNDDRKIQIMLHSISYVNSRIIQTLDKPEYFTKEVFDVFAAWLRKEKENLDFNSVLEQGTEISLMLDLHYLVSTQLRLSNEPEKWLHYIADKASLEFDNACMLIASLPVKLIAAEKYSNAHLFIRNPYDEIVALTSFAFKSNIYRKFIPAFRLVQYCAEFCGDKDLFLRKVGSIFGIEGTVESTAAYNNFFLFVLNIAVDRTCFTLNKEEIIEKSISLNLKSANSLIYKEMVDRVPHFLNSEEHEKMIKKVVSSYSVSFSKNGNTMFKAKDNVKWDIIVPWAETKTVLNVIEQFATKNKDIPFQIRLQDGEDELLELLLTSCLMLVANNNLLSGNQVMIQLSCAYYILFAAHAKNNEFIDGVFSLKIPSMDERKALSPKEVLEKSALGIETLKQIGINVSIPESEKEMQKNRNKERALAAKQAALESLKMRMGNFNDDALSDDNDDDVDECCVCNGLIEGRQLFYQIYSIKTPLASIINNEPIESMINISICQHLIHKECATPKCPMDRITKNGLVPIFDTNLVNTDIKLYDIDGMDKFSQLFAEEDSDFDLVHIAKTIASMITIIEARDRIDPAVINSKAYRYLFKAIIKLFWHKFTIPQVDISAFNPMTKLILFFLFEDESTCSDISEIKEKYNFFVTQIYGSLKKNEVLPFIRRAGILENYLFTESVDQFFDFDDFLEYSNLCEHFGVKEVEYEPLNGVNIIKAPQSASELLLPPFDEDVNGYNSNTFYCLYDGELVIGDTGIQFHSAKYGGSCVPFIFLTGPNAFLTIIFWNNKLLRISPIYTNEDGVTNFGWSTDERIILNKERVLNLERYLLAGSLSN